MSLLKRHTRRRRHMGRRAAGVAVGVALIVLGLEAPAFAVTPTVGSFSPSSGPGGCVVQITGTNFQNPTVTAVQFGSLAATAFRVVSDTEIWAISPGGAASSGFITVTNGDGTASSAVGWVNATPGTCSPTITSVTPSCGPAGTEVTITGTNLLDGVGTTAASAGDVFFGSTTTANSGTAATEVGTPTFTEIKALVPAGSPASLTGPIAVGTFNNTIGSGGAFAPTPFTVGTCVTGLAPTSGAVGTLVTITGVGFQSPDVTAVTFSNNVPATFTVVSDTEITTTVPFGATDGPITLSTTQAPNGTSVQTASFDVAGVTPPVHHPRNVTLKLSGALRMKGKVKVPDGTTECFSGVPVKLQRKKKGGGFKTLKTVTTNDTGAYSGKVRNKPGKYRSVAPKVTLANTDICDKDVSPIRKN
jgi:IPT/TIG domain